MLLLSIYIICVAFMFYLLISLSFMIQTLIIGIIGSLIAAAAFELWRNRRKKYHISLSLDSSEVYSSQKQSDVSIRVAYKGKTVKNSLVVLYLSLTNDGDNDIMFNSHFSDIIRITCKGYRFLSISSEDERIKPKCELTDGGEALLSWDILKRGEQVQICLTAQSNEPKNGLDSSECFNGLQFDFRSDCIDSIKPLRKLSKPIRYYRRVLNELFFFFAYFALISLLFFYLDISFSSRYNIKYKETTYENATLLHVPLLRKYIINSDNAKPCIFSKGDIDKVTEVIPVKEFTVANKVSVVTEVLIVLTLLCIIIFMVSNRVRYVRSGKGYLPKKRIMITQVKL